MLGQHCADRIRSSNMQKMYARQRFLESGFIERGAGVSSARSRRLRGLPDSVQKSRGDDRRQCNEAAITTSNRTCSFPASGSPTRASLEKDDAQADPTAISGKADTAG